MPSYKYIYAHKDEVQVSKVKCGANDLKASHGKYTVMVLACKPFEGWPLSCCGNYLGHADTFAFSVH